jgi:hypothetical protein
MVGIALRKLKSDPNATNLVVNGGAVKQLTQALTGFVNCSRVGWIYFTDSVA